MKILGWNCRGICNASTARALRATIRVHNPDVVFLCETKASEEKIVGLACSMGFPGHIVVGAQGKAGGICMFWSNTLDVEVLEFNARTIAITIRDGVCSWALVGFYGPPYRAKRRKAWENLHGLLKSIKDPWICFGDFNVVLENSEKIGGNFGSASTPNYLKELTFDLGAIDLGFVGNKFTWWNKRWGRGSIKERLDRAISDQCWRTLFPNASVVHLGAINSDHTPLIIDTNPSEEFFPRPFRFEAIWTRDPRCSGVINEAWNREVQGAPCYKLYRKQSNTTKALKKWNREVFGNCQTKISELSSLIEKVQSKEMNESNARKEAALQCELEEWMRRNEVLWRQKSREVWLKDGDKNSKFFHLSTIIRRRKNSIDAIKAEDGSWLTCKKEIRIHIVEKFAQLFSEEDVIFPQDLDNLITPSITEVENSELCRMPTPQEIKATIFDMNGQKSPGPDGLPALFYKKYWKIVAPNVTAAVQSFFHTGKLLPEINNSLLVLIPKNKNPSTVNHYRPISLCNTVYKTIAKLLVSKLRPVLGKLVSPCQSAFIPRRWIAENQLLVHEILHSFKKRKVKGGFLAMKIDLQKAYDRVNWDFLRTVLKNFGFQEVFVNWIMECVTTVSFSILINGGKSNSFKSSRGLRQGDPLSPYLFILCQEVLARLIEKERVAGNIAGVKLNIGGPDFTNVMFADDLMLFSKAGSRDATNLNSCLEKYCVWSGQRVNRDKSGLIFSKLVSLNQRRRIKSELQMKKISDQASYLGAPLFSSGNRTKDFKYLQDKLEARLLGWRSKSLSWAGRSTLIKSVAQAIPTYTFSTFDVPIGVCDKLDAATRRFWWNPKKSNGRYLAWASWDKLCTSKIHGGLGFRKSKKFNEAMLAKLTWMIASKRESPCMAALRSKYKVTNDWLFKDPIKYASMTWKAIERMKPLIRKGACYLVGDGSSIDVWKEPWVPWLVDYIPKPKNDSNLQPLKVQYFIDPINRTWNLNKLHEIFEPRSVEAIQRIIIPAIPRKDRLVWILDPKGKFSVKSTMNISHPQPEEVPDPCWKALRKLKLHDRYKFLVWRIASGILPTKSNLAVRIDIRDTTCTLCGEGEETIDHLFFTCPVARAIWFGGCWAIRSDLITLNSCQEIAKLICEPPMVADIVHSTLKDLTVQTSIQFALTLDSIWNLRNKVFHNGIQINIISTVKALEVRIFEHLNSLKKSDNPNGANNSQWEAPIDSAIKINVDAALNSEAACIAAVARNHSGNIIRVWAKKINFLDPAIAEAAAINWALNLAIEEGFERVIVESDAKNCIDELSCSPEASSWRFNSLSSHSLELVSHFQSCYFHWVRRNANQTAHALAKVAFTLCLPFSCNQDRLPPSVKEAWLRDLAFLLS